MQRYQNGDEEPSVENLVYESYIHEDIIYDFYKEKLKAYASNRLIDTRCIRLSLKSVLSNPDIDDQKLESIILKYMVRLYWSTIIQFYNTKEMCCHLGLDYFENTKLTIESVEKTIRYNCEKFYNKRTEHMIENHIKYMFENPNFFNSDIITASIADNYKNINFVNNKMLIQIQNPIIDTSMMDYKDDFRIYVYKAQLRNTVFDNVVTYTDEKVYMDEYHKIITYSLLYTIGGKEFKKFLKNQFGCYLPDSSIECLYASGRQFIHRHKDLKIFTEFETQAIKCELITFFEDYNENVWKMNKHTVTTIQQKYKEKAKKPARQKTVNGKKTTDTFNDSKNCDINVKETIKENISNKNNYNIDNSFTLMSQYTLSPEEQYWAKISDGIDPDDCPSNFWDLLGSDKPPKKEKTEEELFEELLEQRRKEKLQEALRNL